MTGTVAIRRAQLVARFDATLGNKHDKLDHEACVTLPDGRLIAFGSRSTPAQFGRLTWEWQ